MMESHDAVGRLRGPRPSRHDAGRTLQREAGLSLLETVMALALTLLVLGALFELASPVASVNRSLPETANVQQRLRHAFDRLHTDLLAAGRGTVLVSPGPLGRFLPPVVPYRLGLRADDGEHRRARSSAVTTLSVSLTSASSAHALGRTAELASGLYLVNQWRSPGGASRNGTASGFRSAGSHTAGMLPRRAFQWPDTA